MSENEGRACTSDPVWIPESLLTGPIVKRSCTCIGPPVQIKMHGCCARRKVVASSSGSISQAIGFASWT